jgi:VCBS repeat-containing protein
MTVTVAPRKGHKFAGLVLAVLALLALAALPSAAAAAPPSCPDGGLKLTKERDPAHPSVSGALQCTDADADTLSYSFPEGPAGQSGMFSVSPEGTVTYTPDDADFAGSDLQSIQVSDGTDEVWVYAEVFIYRSKLTMSVSGPTTVTAGSNATYTVTTASAADSQDDELLSAFVQTSANSLDGVSLAADSQASCDSGGVSSLFVDCPEFGTVAPGNSTQLPITFSFGPAAVGKTFEFTFATRSEFAAQSRQDLTIHVVAPSGGGGSGGGDGGGGGTGDGGGGAGGGGTDTTPPAPTAIKGASTVGAGALLKSGYANQILGLTPGDNVRARLELSRSAARGIGAAAKPVVIGTGKAVANAQGTANLRVKLTRKAKAALRKAKKKKSLKATLVMTITDAAGNSTVRKKQVSIKLKR